MLSNPRRQHSNRLLLVLIAVGVVIALAVLTVLLLRSK